MLRPKRLIRRKNTSSGYEEERLRALLDSMSSGVIALDEQLHVELYNGAALNILDSNAGLAGAPIVKRMQLMNRDKQPVDLKKLIESSTSSSNYRNYRLVYPDGSWIALHMNVSPVTHSYGRGERRGYVLIMRDITREKSLEEERNEFISVVSHELRTPIAIAEGSIGNAQIVADRSEAPDLVKKALAGAHDQVVFLAEMINDLSTLSRAERGKLNVEVENIDMHEFLTELVAGYQEQAKQNGLTLDLALPHAALTLRSGKLYVREILQNLITNALKYTREGGVTVKATATDAGVSVSVHDTGIGIKKQEQDKIFDKFWRSEDYRTRETNGTGLGLYVTVKLLELLHADIDITSKLNHGSTFTANFPNLG